MGCVSADARDVHEPALGSSMIDAEMMYQLDAPSPGLLFSQKFLRFHFLRWLSSESG